MVDAALKTLEELGAHVEEVTIPSLSYCGPAQQVIMLSEAFAYHERNLRSKPEEFGEVVRAWFRMGGLFTSADYVQAQRVRNVLKREFAETLGRVDLVASPTMSIPAPRFDEVVEKSTIGGRVPSFTMPYNMTGMPAITVPCGFTSSGLPIGLQLAARPFDEPTAFRAAYTYEQHARWFDRRPPV
jgi:aspartyl-tRNA(Asn)/glutamyl-tRNA(Gln) amidotransferase subunit A